jgi:hypothetical protein
MTGRILTTTTWIDECTLFFTLTFSRHDYHHHVPPWQFSFLPCRDHPLILLLHFLRGSFDPSSLHHFSFGSRILFVPHFTSPCQD